MSAHDPVDRLSPARQANRRLNIEEFEAARVELRSLPRVLFMELTENCNLSCPMCRSAGRFDAAKNMPDELFDRVAAELFPTAEIVDLRGWGESTVLKSFPSFVDRTLEYGCRLRLVTNLTVSNDELWRRLVRERALIDVSVDTVDEAVLAKVRPGAKLEVMMRNLRIMADEGRSSGVGTDNVVLNVTLQADALDTLERIVLLGAELGFRVHLGPVTTGPDDPQNLRFHRERLAEALGRTALAAARTGVEVQLNAAPEELWADHSAAAKRCTHPWMYCYVNHRGQVGFCDHLIGAPGDRYLLGNLATSSFAQIWNGRAYQDLRAEHANFAAGFSHRFEECAWCYRNRYVDFDQVSYPPYERDRVLLSPDRCAAFVGAADPLPPSAKPLPLVFRSDQDGAR